MLVWVPTRGEGCDGDEQYTGAVFSSQEKAERYRQADYKHHGYTHLNDPFAWELDPPYKPD